MLKRNSILVVVICLQVFFTRSAMADTNSTPPPAKSGTGKTEKKAKGHPWRYLVGLPTYYLLVQSPIHETSHMVAVGFSSNFQLTSFQPFPHYNKDVGRFSFFGSTSFSCPNERACADKTGLGVIFLAPYITDVALFTTSDLLLSTGAVDPGTTAGKLLYIGGMVMPWWDLIFNSIWQPAGSDGEQISRNFNISLDSTVLIGMGVSTIGLLRLMVNHKKVFGGKKSNPAKTKSSLIILPTSGSGTVGISAGMRF